MFELAVDGGLLPVAVALIFTKGSKTAIKHERDELHSTTDWIFANLAAFNSADFRSEETGLSQDPYIFGLQIVCMSYIAHHCIAHNLLYMLLHTIYLAPTRNPLYTYAPTNNSHSSLISTS